MLIWHFSGQCLNFNCTFILVLMLRQCITFLRTRGYSSVLPLDQHIYFHKLTGLFIFGYSVFHTVMHVCNFSKYYLLLISYDITIIILYKNYQLMNLIRHFCAFTLWKTLCNFLSISQGFILPLSVQLTDRTINRRNNWPTGQLTDSTTIYRQANLSTGQFTEIPIY